jgi:hypothetical protein
MSHLHRELLLEGQTLTETCSILDKLNLIEEKDRHHTGGGGFIAGLALGRLDAAVGKGTDDEGSPNVQSTLRAYGMGMRRGVDRGLATTHSSGGASYGSV